MSLNRSKNKKNFNAMLSGVGAFVLLSVGMIGLFYNACSQNSGNTCELTLEGCPPPANLNSSSSDPSTSPPTDPSTSPSVSPSVDPSTAPSTNPSQTPSITPSPSSSVVYVPGAINPSCVTSKTPVVEGTTSQLNTEMQIASEINIFRQENGKSPLQLNQIMSYFARGHAQYMYQQGVISHLYFSERLSAIACHGISGYGGGENVASGGNPVSLWKNSTAGHRENMLGSYRNMGVAYVNGYSVLILN